MRKRIIAAAVVAAIAAGGGLLTAASKGSTGSGSRISNGLVLTIVPTNRGPLSGCTDQCGADSLVWDFVYVTNTNPLTNAMGLSTRSRATFPNAFAVSSIDETILVDGVQYGDVTHWTPPPAPSPLRSYSGRWVSTVTCPDGTDPCNIVGSPAVIPLENTAVLYTGWFHGADEPTGTYVFRYTVHGTLNGAPVDLTADSPPIQMTSP